MEGGGGVLYNTLSTMLTPLITLTALTTLSIRALLRTFDIHHAHLVPPQAAEEGQARRVTRASRHATHTSTTMLAAKEMQARVGTCLACV